MYIRLLNILFLIIFIFLEAAPVFAGSSGTILRPSLESQMKLQEIQNRKATNITRLEQLQRKRQALKMQNNTQTTTSTQQATGGSPMSTNRSVLTQSPPISGVNIDRVRTTWLGWYNTYRKSLGLGAYRYDSQLDATAYSWNIQFSAGKGQNHHRRNPSDSYYDYPIITKWFKERGVVAKIVNGATTTENVGWGVYRCTSNDCTDALINSIRSTFDFFMSEKSYNGVHYKSIVQPNFTKVGVSIIVIPGEYRYYLVMHFITE